MGSDFYGWRRPGFLPGVVVFGVVFAITAYAWVVIPPDTPITTQWDVGGNPSTEQSKAFALLSVPIVILVVALAADVIPFMPYSKKFDPDKEGTRLLAWYISLVVLSIAQLVIIVGALRRVGA